jgi:hypothetical protein
MSTQQNQTQSLTLFNAHKPAYPAGTLLKLTADHTGLPQGSPAVVIGSDKTCYLKVTGPQTHLGPGDVLGVYPTPDSTDSPENFLPHIALRRSTLPWERTGDTRYPAAPWLALLVFTESELKSRPGSKPVQSMSVDTWCQKLAGTDTKLWADAGHSEVEVIFPPKDLLTQPGFLPTAEELALLCHMRQVPSQDQLAQLDDDGKVAIVIANRFPTTAGEKHYACLVSLEGHQGLLKSSQPLVKSAETGPVQSAAAAAAQAAAGQAPTQSAATVPLLVLHHWCFTPTEKGDFEAVIQGIGQVGRGAGVMKWGLKGADMLLSHGLLPITEVDGSLLLCDGNAVATGSANQDLARQVLYRGPLVPPPDVTAAAESATKDGAPPVARAPKLFAVARQASATTIAPKLTGHQGYLAAFELGRWLTLSNREHTDKLNSSIGKLTVQRPPRTVVQPLQKVLQNKHDAIQHPLDKPVTHPMQSLMQAVVPLAQTSVEPFMHLSKLCTADSTGMEQALRQRFVGKAGDLTQVLTDALPSAPASLPTPATAISDITLETEELLQQKFQSLTLSVNAG